MNQFLIIVFKNLTLGLICWWYAHHFTFANHQCIPENHRSAKTGNEANAHQSRLNPLLVFLILDLLCICYFLFSIWQLFLTDSKLAEAKSGSATFTNRLNQAKTYTTFSRRFSACDHLIYQNVIALQKRRNKNPLWATKLSEKVSISDRSKLGNHRTISIIILIFKH